MFVVDERHSRHLPSVSPGTSSPCANSVIGTDKVVASVDCIIAIRLPFDEVPIDKSAAVAAEVVRTQGVGEGGRGR